MKKILLSTLILFLVTVNSAQAQEAYAVLSQDESTLTFYYDKNKSSRNGMDIGPFSIYYPSSYPVWKDKGTITTVIFDESLSKYTGLTSTACWFYGLYKLTSIHGIENLKTDHVTDMSAMFWCCNSLTSLDVTHFNTASVKYMEDMFWGCWRLKTLDVTHFNTANVISMDDMFGACMDLQFLDVSHFNTANVKYMAGMFEDCQSLTSLDVSHFNTSEVTNMADMFNYCIALTSLDLSHFKTDKVKQMNGMFHGDGSLTTIYCNDTWSCDYSHGMFTDCTSLRGAIMYDENKIDAKYANPDTGYFTRKAASPSTVGDANGDGQVNTEDIVEVVNTIVGSPSVGYDAEAADTNGDGVVNAADIIKIVSIIIAAE